MKFRINTIDDFDVEGKTVFLRVDINQPVNKEENRLEDTTRIEACLPTVKELAEKGAKLVILAHQGSDVEYQNYYHLAVHAEVLTALSGRKIDYVPDVCGPYAQQRIQDLKEGEVILLDNVRFMAEEMTLFETKLNLTPEQQTRTQVVAKLAPLGDLYVCDAFAAAHRAQPSLTAFQQLLPSAMGRLFEREYGVLAGMLENPHKPLVLVLGGAKIQDAFLMMEKVLGDGIADTVLTGGLVGQVMLIADGVDIGRPSHDFIIKKNLGEYIDKSKKLLEEHPDKILLPSDLAYSNEVRHNVPVEEMPSEGIFMDLGDKSARRYAEVILQAGTVFVNGPVGVFENPLTEYGTRVIWQALADTKAFTVLGGGDSITATNKYLLSDRMGYICTGGGAMVRFMSGEVLPAVAALKESARKFGNERG